MTVAEIVLPLVAGVVGARFGRLIDWPFRRLTSRSSQVNARYDLSNRLFWATLTCLVVNSAVTIIGHMV